MGKLLKRLILLGFVAGLLAAGSYFGARAAAGKFVSGGKELGSDRGGQQLGERTIKFRWEPVRGIPASRRTWEFTYSSASVNDNYPIKIYVSPTGKIVATVPDDLGERLAAAAKSADQ